MILVIEDNHELAQVTCELLGKIGYHAMSASSGEEGISKAKEHKPGVILCDIKMAGMTGYDVARFIRQDDELKDAYLVAISGYSSAQDIKTSLDAGFDRHLAKPVRLGVLKKVLDDHLLVSR